MSSKDEDPTTSSSNFSSAGVSPKVFRLTKLAYFLMPLAKIELPEGRFRVKIRQLSSAAQL
jgi:hypothetical protein